MKLPELEKLIRKPRAFRQSSFAEKIPTRQIMVILGSEYITRLNTSSNFKRVRNNLKQIERNKKNDLFF
jgi:hypothetical protein